MKNFLTFTLAAGVAITSAQVVHAAGVTRVSADRLIKAQAQMPASPSATSAAKFDNAALNRELARISELLGPVGLNDGLMDDAVVVPKKTAGSFMF